MTSTLPAPDAPPSDPAALGREPWAAHARYVFPGLPELAEQFPDFALREGTAGTYPLAGCCPVFALTPRP